MSVEVCFLGHLGNNLFQYALGRILAEEHGMALRCRSASETPGFAEVERASGIVDRLEHFPQHFAEVLFQLPGREVAQPQNRFVMGERPGWSGHGLPFNHLMRLGGDTRIVLHGYFQRAEYYHPYRDRIRRWYAMVPRPGLPEPGPRDVIVHLRQSLDMKVLDRALALSYYQQALSLMSFDRVYVCGLGLDDPEVRSALAPWRPIWLALPAIDTLALMTRFRQIVMANSTFSWWGAYLAPEAEVVFPTPLRGVWGPEWPEVSLAVPEARYHYVDDVPARVWRPWRWLGKNLWSVVEQSGGLMLAGPMGAARWNLPLYLGPALQWMLETEGIAFGFEELSAHGLPVGARPAIQQVLLALAQAGVLEADADWLSLVQGAVPRH